MLLLHSVKTELIDLIAFGIVVTLGLEIYYGVEHCISFVYALCVSILCQGVQRVFLVKSEFS